MRGLPFSRVSKDEEPSLFILMAWMLLLLAGAFAPVMFVDGVTYATIARNLAEGQGTWFALHYTETLAPSFFGHPPLWIWIESIFFSVLGDQVWVEKGVSLLFFSLYLLALWRAVGSRSLWLAILPLSVGLFWWIPGQNLMEIPLAAGLLWLTHRAEQMERNPNLAWLCVQGLGFTALLLIKGPVAGGLLPGMMAFALAKKQPWFSVIRSIFFLVGIPVLVISGLCWLYPPAWHYAQQYVNQQLYGSALVEKTAPHRWYILERLFLEWLPLLVFLCLLAWKVPASVWRSVPWKKIWPWWWIGLASILPFLLIEKQSHFYLFPGLGLMLPGCIRLLNHLKPVSIPVFRPWMAMVGLVAGLVVGFVFSRPPKEKWALHDQVQTFNANYSEGTPAFTCHAAWTNWYLHAYLARHGRHSLYARDQPCAPLITAE